MGTIEFQAYWQDRQSSMNRGDDSEYYSRKAAEHLAILTRSGSNHSLVDFGCGAGELLGHISPNYGGPITGVDFSRSLLERAAKALSHSGVELIESEAFLYAVGAHAMRWMTCGAVNQYSDAEQLDRFMVAFRDNDAAREFVLFDTIDPIRLRMVEDGLIDSYLRLRPTLYTMRSLAKSIRAAIRAVRIRHDRRQVVPLGEIGFGVKLDYWRQVANDFGLSAVFVSSVEFEYRYHVVLSKV